MSGYMPIGMILLCGATTTQLIPTNFLGTTIYSGLNIGIICSIVNVILVTIYVEVLMRTCRKKELAGMVFREMKKKWSLKKKNFRDYLQQFFR